jgi:competence protein ComEC
MKKKIYFTLILAVLCFLIWFLVFRFGSDGKLHIYFLNVGQGDATFIETPDKFQILIDGGPDNSVLSELSEVMPFYDREIDLIAFTHPQNDHIFGLVEVLKRYEVKNIMFSSIVYQNRAYDEIRRIIKEKNINIIDPKAGERLEMGELVFMDVLYPFESAEGAEVDNPNDISMSLRLNYLGKRFLFSGDAELKEEMKMVNSEEDLDVDVLKINHHGSKTSSSELFLQKTSPELAVISVGKKNPYGHPNDIVLNRLKNIELLRTDYNGRINIFTDGATIEYKTEF